MCTAITYQAKDAYFGRTLDHTCSYGETVTITPRNFPLSFHEEPTMPRHYAIIGMAHVADGYPLYYDAVNEKGLAMAGLHFVGNAHYNKSQPGKQNVAAFELMGWILGTCASVEQVRQKVKTLNLTDTAFSTQLPPAQLHWLIADQSESIVLEAGMYGVEIYSNPVGVLTNNPPFPMQLFQLNNYMHLSVKTPENLFSKALSLIPYSYGMGALGLPGDWSSQSRFVRAAFVKAHAQANETEEDSVRRFFQILGTVSQVKGCCDTNDGMFEWTRYSACCNLNRGIYYYTSCENEKITAVDLFAEDLELDRLIEYPLRAAEAFELQNVACASRRR